MAYQKQTWNADDIITAEKLNHIESGIAEAEKVPAQPGKATTAKEGIVKMAAAVTDAAGENVTKAEFNALLTSLRNAGILSPT